LPRSGANYDLPVSAPALAGLAVSKNQQEGGRIDMALARRIAAASLDRRSHSERFFVSMIVGAQAH
jgi:hypothetical protein